MRKYTPTSQKPRKLPAAVRNLVALHSLALESRYRNDIKNRNEAGWYNVLQRRQVLEYDDRTIITFRNVAVIHVDYSATKAIEEILAGLKE